MTQEKDAGRGDITFTPDSTYVTNDYTRIIKKGDVVYVHLFFKAQNLTANTQVTVGTLPDEAKMELYNEAYFPGYNLAAGEIPTDLCAVGLNQYGGTLNVNVTLTSALKTYVIADFCYLAKK